MPLARIGLPPSSRACEVAQDFTGMKDFDGNRWNDLHYTRAVKQTARDPQRANAGNKT
jgi:hypothetical protein